VPSYNSFPATEPYSGTSQRNGWYTYLNEGGYTADETDALVDALMGELKEVVDRMLPSGVTWWPDVSQFDAPNADAIPAGDHLDEIFTAAFDNVNARLHLIEPEVLASFRNDEDDVAPWCGHLARHPDGDRPVAMCGTTLNADGSCTNETAHLDTGQYL
jgi:hypothetical protein